MKRSEAEQLFTAQDDQGAIDEPVLEQALGWLVTLQSGIASAEDETACLQWRQADPRHELAWRRLHGLGQDLRNATRRVPPALARSTLRDEPLHSRRILLKSVIGLGVIGLSGWLANDRQALPHLFADYRTGTGQRRRVELADGTHVTLDSASAIDVRFNPAERRIILLSGQIFVSSGKDPLARPLRVVTQMGSVTPVGTRFNLSHEQMPGEECIQVGVLEGAVDIRPLDGSRVQRLHAGQQLRFDRQVIDPAVDFNAASTAWTQGMLVADRMRLIEVIKQLDRNRPGVLRCHRSVAGLRVSGSFSLDDPEAGLGLLEEILPIKVSYVTRYWASVSAR